MIKEEMMPLIDEILDYPEDMQGIKHNLYVLKELTGGWQWAFSDNPISVAFKERPDVKWTVISKSIQNTGDTDEMVQKTTKKVFS